MLSISSFVSTRHGAMNRSQESSADENRLQAARARPFLAGLARHVAAGLQGDAALGRGELVVGPAGQVYPFLQFPLAAGQETPGSILGFAPREPAPEDDFLLPQAAKELWDVGAATGRLMDRPTYRVIAVRREATGLKLDAALGGYRDSFITQDWLERELLLAATAHEDLPEREFDAFLHSLSTRRQLLEKLHAAGLPASALLEGTRFRSAAIAVSVLLVFRDETGLWRTPVRLRSAGGVSVHGNMFHVVPSGMLQPTVGPVAEQWDLDDFLDREFAEELFGEDFDDVEPAVYRGFRRSGCCGRSWPIPGGDPAVDRLATTLNLPGNPAAVEDRHARLVSACAGRAARGEGRGRSATGFASTRNSWPATIRRSSRSRSGRAAGFRGADGRGAGRGLGVAGMEPIDGDPFTGIGAVGSGGLLMGRAAAHEAAAVVSA